MVKLFISSRLNKFEIAVFIILQASMVHDLLVSYQLCKHLKVVRSSPASYCDLKKFHSELYLDYLKSVKEVEEDYVTNTQDEEYGVGE